MTLYKWVQLCPSSQAFSVNAFRLRIQVSKTNSLGLRDPKRIGLIMLATRKSMIEREQPFFPNQLKHDRPDSWATVFGAPRGTFAKPRHGGHQILFHEYAAKLIRSRKSPHSSRNSYFGNGPQSLKAHGGRLLAPLGSPMSASAKHRGQEE